MASMISVPITKTDEDQHLVFGWANLPRPATLKTVQKDAMGMNAMGDAPAVPGRVLDTDDSLEEFLRDLNEAYRAQFPDVSGPGLYCYRYIVATFPTSVIVSCEGDGADCDFMQHAYVVDGESIVFGPGTPVEQVYVAKRLGECALRGNVSKALGDDAVERVGQDLLDKYVAQAKAGDIKTDLQDDAIPMDELEKAAYDFVAFSGVGGTDHERVSGHLVESFFATTQKYLAMGIPADVAETLNEGWFVGFRVEDEATWEGVKSGRYKMFSIGGRSQRTAVEE